MQEYRAAEFQPVAVFKKLLEVGAAVHPRTVPAISVSQVRPHLIEPNAGVMPSNQLVVKANVVVRSPPNCQRLLGKWEHRSLHGAGNRNESGIHGSAILSRGLHRLHGFSNPLNPRNPRLYRLRGHERDRVAPVRIAVLG